ncbi:MAG: hypothetical protein K2I46_02210, partial [Clostridia bacterium]|nr:hypothetical protein [Clostridia bacterium]
ELYQIMAEDRQDNWGSDSDFMIADDEQIANMQKEYASIGVCGCRNESRFCTYPLPVYMTEHCFAFCKSGKEMLSILGQLDQIFVARNKQVIDFIIKSIGKNTTAIALKGDITQEIFLPAKRMPMKQSMYRLLELHNLMSIALDELCVYDKSVGMQEVVTRHLLLGSILHGICI